MSTSSDPPTVPDSAGAGEQLHQLALAARLGEQQRAAAQAAEAARRTAEQAERLAANCARGAFGDDVAGLVVWRGRPDGTAHGVLDGLPVEWTEPRDGWPGPGDAHRAGTVTVWRSCPTCGHPCSARATSLPALVELFDVAQQHCALRRDLVGGGTGLLGRLVERFDDDSDCPVVGEIRGLDDDPAYVRVAWGENRRHDDGPASTDLDALDELRPARPGVGARGLRPSTARQLDDGMGGAL
jgi:hypothetical protein